MNIVVLIKETPDTAELPHIAAEDVQAGDIDADMVINPWDEYAVEEAVQLMERFDGESVAISLGPEASEAIKHALAMGVSNAVFVEDEEVDRRDDWAIATILSSAVKEQGRIDLVLAGQQSVDGNSGTIYVGVARKLGWPLLANVRKIVDAADGVITVERMVDGGKETVTAPLPAVLSVAKEINEPRYPSIMGIRKASRAEVPTKTISDLGLAGLDNKVSWSSIRKPEERSVELEIVEGASVAEKAKKLVDSLMQEKII